MNVIPSAARLPGNAVLTEVHADRIVLRRGTVFETLKFADAPTVLTTAAAVDDMQPQEIYDPGEMSVPETYTEPTVDAVPEPTQDGGATGANATSSAASLTNVVQSYRERLQQDPTGTLSALGVAPVSTSGAQGYRLDNLAQSPYLAQTGLQAGDVVLSVNGRPVGDVQQDKQQLDNMLAQGSARLEVQRGDTSFLRHGVTEVSDSARC